MCSVKSRQELAASAMKGSLTCLKKYLTRGAYHKSELASHTSPSVKSIPINFNQNCQARSVYFYIDCIALMGFSENSRKKPLIFKMTDPAGEF